MPSRDKPLPPDSADRAAGPGAGSAEADAEAVEAGAGAARRVGRKGLTRCGARSA